MKERLQKILAGAGLMSRRAAEEEITKGRVSVNGHVASLGDKADPDYDQILFDGRSIPRQQEKIYLMLNKPRGYVTTLHDEKGRRSVIELLPGLKGRVYPVGRLDMDSEGLLLLTNDGDFADHIMHPAHEITKTYRTWVEGEDPEAAAITLRQPMELEGYLIHPAEVVPVRVQGKTAVLDISIHEGRNRQVRKMCTAAGLKVTRLCRIREGSLSLGDLKKGCWRYLRAEEVRSLLDESI